MRLEDIHSNNSFEIPENYFESLEKAILVQSELMESKTVFQTPENYFENVEKTILFETISKKNVFQTPENYFENLENTIIKKGKKNKSNIISFSYLKYTSIGIAASFIIGFFGLEYLENNTQKVSVSMQDKEKAHEEIYQTVINPSVENSISNEKINDVFESYYVVLNSTETDKTIKTELNTIQNSYKQDVSEILYDIYSEELIEPDMNEDELF